MDMNTAFDLEVRQHCPKARIVYDLYHVVAKYGREVIDRVRVDEANRLKHKRPLRRVVKRSRWLPGSSTDDCPAAWACSTFACNSSRTASVTGTATGSGLPSGV